MACAGLKGRVLWLKDVDGIVHDVPRYTMHGSSLTLSSGKMRPDTARSKREPHHMHQWGVIVPLNSDNKDTD
jgi:hypothetical protein